MRSDTVIIHFPPVKFQKGLEYLKGITGPMTSVIRDFSALKDEQQMANFKNPSWVSDKMREYREDRDTEEMTLRSLEDIRLIMIDNHSVRISHTV